MQIFSKGNINPIERKVLRQDIKRFLLDAIVTGQLKPGERIVETRVAKELQVSQAPVREAIRELEQIGLIETKPFQGAFVKATSVKELRDAYACRELLESYAAKEAARLMTEEQIRELRELVEKMVVLAQEGEHAAYVEHDTAFHLALVKAADNSMLEKLWSIVRMGNLVFVSTRFSRKSLPEMAAQHQGILEALEERNPEKAAVLVKSHIEGLAAEILKSLER
ncbi:MAG: GntR family transcriptional regulator [Bacillota bacterium]|uniref:FCD domain-containing protein n=1 Tax=Thermanaerosceptrum fracticalcis TaxID=1712410 RepID=A0A7G6E5D6_THEFR|nr:GntR family transcriptional regulator [Thermanaerosceptrum fracticalcis]QNB47290.1 FCD domain-containing protein [Thermanaerosceptrum fracticalcis]